MVKEVEPGIHLIELPLPRNPLRSVNSYVIKGDNRSLVIDTGMNRDECREVLDEQISEIGLDLGRTDVLVTHLHADHLGLAPHITKGKGKVFMGAPDIEMIEEKDYWTKMHGHAVANGFPDLDPMKAIRKHPGYKYGPLGKMNLIPIGGGEVMEYGGRKLKVIHTPGHSHGHMCIYDVKEKLLFSGDHILGDITPNISQWSDEETMLRDYMGSLELVSKLEVDKVLPGHRSIVSDHRKRIIELIDHHEERANEIIAILGDVDLDGMTIASKMRWDLTYRRFEEFPIMQKWFALGEAIAHIGYLEGKGKVRRRYQSGTMKYSKI